MKSVALTEGKKPYFYDLNRQPGIKRNFSPEISHAAGLQQAGMGRHWLQRVLGCAAGARCGAVKGDPADRVNCGQTHAAVNPLTVRAAPSIPVA